RLEPFRTLQMDTREIVETFPSQQVIRAIAEGKQSMPADAERRAVYRARLERYEEKKEHKEEPGGSDATSAGDKSRGEQRARRREDRFYADIKAEEVLDLPPDQRFQEILKMSPEEQRAFSSSLKDGKRDEFMQGMDSRQRETLMALGNPQQVVT